MLVQICAALLVMSIVVPFGGYFISGKRYAKGFLSSNLIAFFGILVVSTVVMFTSNGASAAETVANPAAGMQFLAAALSTGLATVGAGIAVSSAASAALGAISENEKILGKSLILVALAEGIALYGMLVSFIILSK